MECPGDESIDRRPEHQQPRKRLGEQAEGLEVLDQQNDGDPDDAEQGNQQADRQARYGRKLPMREDPQRNRRRDRGADILEDVIVDPHPGSGEAEQVTGKLDEGPEQHPPSRRGESPEQQSDN